MKITDFKRNYLGEFPPEVMELSRLLEEYCRQDEQNKATRIGNIPSHSEMRQDVDLWLKFVAKARALGFSEEEWQKAVAHYGRH